MTSGSLKRFHHQSGPNMAPLAAVAMAVLIFLMLAGHFDNGERFLEMSATIHARHANCPPPAWKPPADLDVYVSTDGDVTILNLLNHEPDPDRVKEALEVKLWQLRAANAADPAAADAIQVILHPMPGTKWESLLPLYDAALRADWHTVSFAQTP